MKTLVLPLLIVTSCSCAFAQVYQWHLVDGTARWQTIINVPEKDADLLYKQVNRWLVATFKNPEEALKARIESEYLRGEAYHANFLKPGALTGLDFQYTFSVDIRDGKVRLTLFNGIVFCDAPQDTNAAYPLEKYLEAASKKKKDDQADNVVTSVNILSNSLLKSLESYLQAEPVQKDDW